MPTPHSTPPRFFEEHRERIWNEVADLPSFYTLYRPAYRWAAAVVLFIAGSWLFTLFSPENECISFACLWENTSDESLQYLDGTMGVWLEDDFLFEALTEAPTNNQF
jgi:hypothetical protein